MSELSIQEWLDQVPQHFASEKAADTSGVVQMRLSGDQGGEWFITIHNQQATVTKGVAPNPKVTLSANANDVLKILTGKMDGMRAFMQGKLKVSGDTSFALKLVNLFKP